MRRGALLWMFNWVLCVCFCLPMITSRGCIHVRVCVVLCFMSAYEDMWSGPLHCRASSFPSSWHLSLGRASCGVSLIKASTVWLMNRLCGISAPGWRSHSAAPRLLWGPPFHWALNQETALITLLPSSSSFYSSSLPFLFLLAFSPPSCLFLFCFLTLSLCSTALFLCPSYLTASLSLSLLSCLILGLKEDGGHLGASTVAYITAKRGRAMYQGWGSCGLRHGVLQLLM